MSNTHRVNAKGQVVIPKTVRDRFGLRPGDEVTFHEEKGRLVLLKGGGDPVDRVWGRFRKRCLPGGRGTDEFVKSLRGH